MLISFLGKVSNWEKEKPYKYNGKEYEVGKNYLKDIIMDLKENKLLFVLTSTLLGDEEEKKAVLEFLREFNIDKDISEYLNYDEIDRHSLNGKLNDKELDIYFISFDDVEEDDFEELYEKLKNKLDELKSENILIDITHSYRYLPFITLQILDLLNITSDVKLNGIIYAKDKKDFYELIFVKKIEDFFKYQKAFQNFVELGSLRYMINLIENENTKKLLEELDLALNLNFFQEIEEKFNELKEVIETFDEFPMNIISDKILEFLSTFEKEKISEFQLELAKWHFKYKRLALGLIALEESIRSKHIENCEKTNDRNIVFNKNKRFRDYKLNIDIDCNTFTNDEYKKYWCMIRNLRNIAGHNLALDSDNFTNTNITQRQVKNYLDNNKDYKELIKKLLNDDQFIENLYRNINLMNC